MPTSSSAQNILTGIAGVHFIVSELSLRGLIALPTIRNTAGIDIVVTNAAGTWQANLQVKTSKNKVNFWPIGKHYEDWRGENCWYGFARYLESDLRFELFLETAERVARQVAENTARDQERGNVEWQPCWYLPKNDTELARVQKQWREFGAVT
jgi:hypothetical protein